MLKVILGDTQQMLTQLRGARVFSAIAEILGGMKRVLTVQLFLHFFVFDFGQMLERNSLASQNNLLCCIQPPILMRLATIETGLGRD